MAPLMQRPCFGDDKSNDNQHFTFVMYDLNLVNFINAFDFCPNLCLFRFVHFFLPLFYCLSFEGCRIAHFFSTLGLMIFSSYTMTQCIMYIYILCTMLFFRSFVFPLLAQRMRCEGSYFTTSFLFSFYFIIFCCCFSFSFSLNLIHQTF